MVIYPFGDRTEAMCSHDVGTGVRYETEYPAVGGSSEVSLGVNNELVSVVCESYHHSWPLAWLYWDCAIGLGDISHGPLRSWWERQDDSREGRKCAPGAGVLSCVNVRVYGGIVS